MRIVIIAFLMAILAATAAWRLKPERKPEPQAPPIVSVEKMGTLTTLKVSYANVVEFSERSTRGIPFTDWELRFGGTRVLLIARGDCHIGTDLRLAEYEKSKLHERTLILYLQSPKVLNARLNHDPQRGGSRFFSIDSHGLVAWIPGTDRQTSASNRALAKAQSEIESVCASSDYSNEARKVAETVLQQTISATGWEVRFVWR